MPIAQVRCDELCSSCVAAACGVHGPFPHNVLKTSMTHSHFNCGITISGNSLVPLCTGPALSVHV